ncbi:hypothetical protein MNBD_NITROSPINAE04-904 [hydrothermal vent metagenome]|uniref:SAM-dependent methyltransferase n=1 Tax=hydrothermal vent metagenome TaxID=652676 RepID=A0A3B1BVM3_9ZZZZ
MSANKKNLELDRVVFYGRSLSEYEKFFDLDIPSLEGKTVLDCPAGASSFVAEATKLGIHAVGVDSMYGPNLKNMIDQGTADIEHVMDGLSRVNHLFNWDYFSSLENLRKKRAEALSLFAEDYPIGVMENRYFRAELPHLPYDDAVFDLVLSGHFLFTYGDRFDYSFHLASVREMLRVCCGELRIYPLMRLDAKPSEYISDLLSDLKKEGVKANILPVPFEFQKGADKMLTLSRV